MSDAGGQAGCPTSMQLELFITEPAEGSAIADHLAQCETCRRAADEIEANNALLSQLHGSRINGPTPTGDGLGPAVATGRVQPIDGYEVLGEIQRGGQGVVYRARQLTTNRTVALKVLLAGAFATSRQRRRFEREIELVAGLQHPNVVTIYDSGSTDDGRLYFAMQYIEGKSLDAWRRDLAGERPSLERLLMLFNGICAGVTEAHQHGVIHRDLKPGNILIDAAGQPHILDFGLARPVDTRAASRATVTIAGEFMGTIAYASPEQTRGDPGLIDVRSDVYALGVILHELLTGRLPYPIDGELTDVLRTIQEVEPPAPSGLNPAVGPRLDHEIDTIVLKTLAKEKDRRYQSAAALRDDLQRYLAGEPIDAKRDSGWYVLRKTMRRYRLQATVAAAFLVVLIVSMVGLSIAYGRATLEAEKVKQINLFLEDTLGSVGTPADGGEVTVGELVDEAVRWIDIALGDEPEVAAAVRMTVANSYRGMGRFDDAEHQLQRARAALVALHGDSHLDIARCLNGMGLIRRAQGRLDEAARLIGDALAMRRRLDADPYVISINLANLGLVRRDQGRFDEAIAAIDESMSIRRDLFGDRHQDVAMCFNHLSTIAEASGDLDRAVAMQQRALDIRREVLDHRHPDLARSHHALGALYIAIDRPSDAVRHLSRCVELREESLGPDHDETVAARRLLGSLEG